MDIGPREWIGAALAGCKHLAELANGEHVDIIGASSIGLSTMMQLDLPLARNSDPVSSHDAARGTISFRARHEATIFCAIEDAGSQGATYREIADMTSMEPVAVARRLAGMERRGLIKRWANAIGGYEQRDGMCVWRKAGAA